MGAELIEDRKGSGLRHRQTVDGHFLTPRGLAAFVYFRLLYKSLLFNLEVGPIVVFFNHTLAVTAAECFRTWTRREYILQHEESRNELVSQNIGNIPEKTI